MHKNGFGIRWRCWIDGCLSLLKKSLNLGFECEGGETGGP